MSNDNRIIQDHENRIMRLELITENISNTLNRLELEMKHGFNKIDERLNRMDERFNRMDERFDRMDERFDRMDERFDRIDERFDRMEGRIWSNFHWMLGVYFAGMAAVLGVIAHAMKWI